MHPTPPWPLTVLALLCLSACEDPAGSVDLLDPAGPLTAVPRPEPIAGLQEPAPFPVAVWDFERGDPQGWTHRERDQGGVSATSARTGSHGFRLSSEDGDPAAQVHVSVRPSTRYALEGFLRVEHLESRDSAAFCNFDLGEFDYLRSDNLDFDDPVLWHRDIYPHRGGGEDWVPLHYEFETGPRTRMIRIDAGFRGTEGAAGAVQFDDLRLVELGGSARRRSEAAPDVGSGEAVPNQLLPEIGLVPIGGEFRRAIQARPPSEYVATLRIPDQALLRFAVGIEESVWDSPGDGASFTVEAVRAGQSIRVFERHLDPSSSLDDRGWVDASVSLAPFAGEQVSLAFRTSSSPPGMAPGDDSGDLAVWANPRLVSLDSHGRTRPPLVLITVDTLRPDHLGCYGYARSTSPAIDRLAAEGLLFDEAYTTIPRTTPSLASLMTGLYPRAHGLMTVVDSLPASHLTLAEILKSEGYSTAAFVASNISHRTGLAQGFDLFSDHALYGGEDPDAHSESLVHAASTWVALHQGEPFFLWLHLWNPHFRYLPPAPFDRWFEASSEGGIPLYNRLDSGALKLGQVYFENDLDDEELARAVDLYDGEIRHVDALVGGFLEHLRDLDIYDDALVLFASDHGESLGEHDYFFEHGEYLYNATLRIPMILKLPADNPRDRDRTGPTSILDVMPTILGRLGSPVSSLPGRDLTGAPADSRTLFGETGRSFFPENPRRYVRGIEGNWKSVIADGWKLIQIPVPGGAEYELYDLNHDPAERYDVFDSNRARGLLMIAELESWLASFDGEVAIGSAPLDAQSEARLRTLGYLD